MSQQLRVALAQVPVGGKTNEIPASQTPAAERVLEGRLVTVDALLCQRGVATATPQEGGTTCWRPGRTTPPCGTTW